MPQDLSAVAWPVRTERLTIRPSTAADADAMFDIRSLPEVADWLPILPTDREAWRERFADPEKLAMTLAFELDGEVIGDLYLSVTDAWGQVEVADQVKGTQAEIGWVVAPEHGGKGYGTEGAAELLRICFEDLGPAAGEGAVLRRQRGVVADHGEARHAPRGVRRTRLAAPDPRLARRHDLRDPRRRVAGRTQRRGVTRRGSGPQRRRLAGADRAADDPAVHDRRPRGDVEDPERPGSR